MGTFLFYFLLFFAGLTLLGNLFTLVLQDYFIFRPEKLAPHYTFTFGAPHQEVFLKTKQQGQIHGLWFRRPTPSKGLVLYFHGNKGSVRRWGHLYHFFFRHGYDYFVCDYRGYGKSRGKRTEQTMHEDAYACYQWALNHYPAEDITIFGRSIGSAFATRLASRVPCKQLILETPFSSMRRLFYGYFPFLPRLFWFKYRFQNFRQFDSIQVPITIFQGTEDLIIPYRVAAQLKPYLRKKDAFFTIEQGTHHDLVFYDLYSIEMERILA